ncbi:uncharacterized protein C8Q71DRAFT_725420 [Rhodofomes roseus]|uniref:Uncharacterized protein n=1 Tax=Rhodofomes roseus TaxID=34475 RepID=A0ABQ8KAG4_9APHY|nr:uncharacterized protein C8Q71DRAFT_725420 [Rhodofomes roseus]KAH9834247.1 hypothetical protein C8Q71DRAFT_725420 [Rhodofomes roseus]
MTPHRHNWSQSSRHKRMRSEGPDTGSVPATLKKLCSNNGAPVPVLPALAEVSDEGGPWPGIPALAAISNFANYLAFSRDNSPGPSVPASEAKHLRIRRHLSNTCTQLMALYTSQGASSENNAESASTSDESDARQRLTKEIDQYEKDIAARNRTIEHLLVRLANSERHTKERARFLDASCQRSVHPRPPVHLQGAQHRLHVPLIVNPSVRHRRRILLGDGEGGNGPLDKESLVHLGRLDLLAAAGAGMPRSLASHGSI